MKNFPSSYLRISFSICLLRLIGSVVLFAQEPDLDPKRWETFVYGDQNVLAKDTFLVQTFNGSESDVWPYTTDGSVDLIDPKSHNIKGSSDGYALQLQPNSSIEFAIEADVSLYSPPYVSVVAPYAISNSVKGEILYLTAERLFASSLTNYKVYEPTSNGVNLGFTDRKNDLGVKIVCGSTPVTFNLSCGVATGATKNGFYALDSVYAFGLINQYSLFTGRGSWDTADQWSHLPSLRYRHALLNGHVVVDNNVKCASIHIGDGGVSILSDQRLSVDAVNMYSNESYIASNGTLEIKKQIKILLSLGKPSQWFFASFPFDVYAEGIDPHFQLQDDQFKGEGNYFYVQEYDGNRRARTGEAAGNWRVLPVSVLQGTEPVFRKNKGYLIALDAKATKTTLIFSSRPGNLPSDFARVGRIRIPVSEQIHLTDEHYGWYLCGNPLPAPMPLSCIQPNPDIDDCIYVYDGNQYSAYELNSQYALPPYAAFFVKAKKETELIVHSCNTPEAYTLLSIPSPLRSPKQAEPEMHIATNVDVLEKEDLPLYLFDNSTLRIERLPSAGLLVITDVSGHLFLQRQLSAGSSSIPLSIPRGVYVFTIKSAEFKTQFKYFID